MVKIYGMVPNGGRVYYLRRSQPPLLAAMFFEYFQRTRDMPFLREMLPVLEKEIDFWDNNRRSEVVVPWGDANGTVSYQMYLYKADSNVPRPESFKEDMSQAESLQSEEEKAFLFKSIASAAESGWDFSSRWLRHPLQLPTIETVNIVPVDLNAFMCWNFNIMANLYQTGKKPARQRRNEMQEGLVLQ